MADTLAQRQAQLGGYLLKGHAQLGIPPLPMAAACAIVGNASQENICLPRTPGVKDHGSDGVLQWRKERLMEMNSWCVKNFGRWDTLEAQAAFTLYECARDYPSLYKDLLSGEKTIPTLTANFCDIYERPASASAMLDNRIKYAEDAHALLVETPSKAGPRVAAGTIVATAGAAAAAHASGLPLWATTLILCAGFLVIIILAVIESKK
jgi:hypothetical protein